METSSGPKSLFSCLQRSDGAQSGRSSLGDKIYCPGGGWDGKMLADIDCN